METLKLTSSYLFTLVAVFILDMLWIEYVAQKIYKKYLSDMIVYPISPYNDLSC